MIFHYIFGLLLLLASVDGLFFPKLLCSTPSRSTSLGNCSVPLDSSSHCAPQPGCKNPITLPASLGAAVLLSPFHELLGTNNSALQGVDNTCYTFFRITPSNLLLFRSVVYTDGSNVVQSFIESDFPGCLGLLRGQGLNDAQDGSDTCVYNEYVLGLACPTTFVTYKCYFLGKCDHIDDSVPYCSALSTDTEATELTPLCRAGVYATLGLREVCGNSFIELPNKLSRKCVTTFNDAKCINFERVKPEESISFPVA